jgi:hypothetical protein
MKVVPIGSRLKRKEKEFDDTPLATLGCPKCKGNVFVPVFTLCEVPADTAANQTPETQIMPVQLWLCVSPGCGTVSNQKELVRICPQNDEWV